MQFKTFYWLSHYGIGANDHKLQIWWRTRQLLFKKELKKCSLKKQ